MTDVDATYRGELTLALRRHDLPGRQIGEVLAEVDAHVAETDEDPLDAFGSPHDYATHVAAQLGNSSHGRSTSTVVGAGLSASACALVGTDLLLDGITADAQRVVFTIRTG